MTRWLPDDPDSHELDEFASWQPEQLAAQLGEDYRWEALSYIVVDELEGDVAGLVVSPWPRVDDRGRLHFGDEDASSHVTVEEEAFLALLERRRLPVVKDELDEQNEDALRRRKLTIGDVFAARTGGRFGGAPGDEAPLVSPTKWIRGDVLDITAVAREVAKRQTTSALVGMLEDEYLEAISTERGEKEDA